MSFIYHLFPPTIHPMVVHFTIALPFVAVFFGVIGLFAKKRDFYAKAFFYMLFLCILATIAAGAAGVISEYYVHVSHPVRRMLEDHKNYGEITGILLVAALIAQWWFSRNTKHVSKVALTLCIASAITVSLAGYVGGSMVYDHGLGVHTSTNISAK